MNEFKKYLGILSEDYSKRGLNEAFSTDDMLDALQNASGKDKKFDQTIWSWFEDNMQDSGIYAGDATPDDFLDAMSDKQIEACYKAMLKNFKNVLTESDDSDSESAWTKGDLIDLINSLDDEELQEIGDYLADEIFSEDEYEYDFEDELEEAKFKGPGIAQMRKLRKRVPVNVRKRIAKKAKLYAKKNKARIQRNNKINAKRPASQHTHHKGI